MNDARVRMFAEPLPLRTDERIFFVHAADGTGGFARGGAVDRVELRNGMLVVDGTPILRPHFGARSLSWTQQSTGHFTAGRLDFTPNGLAFHGTVAFGTSAEEATLTPVMGTAIDPTRYRTRITKRRYPADTSASDLPADAWADGSEFELGYRYRPGDPFPELVVFLNGFEIPDRVVLTIGEDGNLEIEIVLEDDASVVCLFDESLYLRGRIVFSTFGDRFDGRITSTCTDRSGDGVYFWKGDVIEDAARQTRPSSENRSLTADDLLEVRALSVAELMTLLPDDEVRALVNNRLVESMKWAMGQSDQGRNWLQTFFQQRTPVLAPEQEELAKKDLAWFQEQFSIGYLTQGLDLAQGPNAPTVKLDQGQRTRLANWLQQTVGPSIPFNRQMIGLFRDAYLRAQPRLADYFADGGAKWARLLFEAITQPDQLTSIIGRASSFHDMTPANNFTTLLYTLDPDGNLGREYMEAVLARALLQQTWATMVRDYDLTMEWMPFALEAFVDAYSAPGTADDDAHGREIANDVRKAALEFGDFAALANQFALLLIAAKGSSLPDQYQNAQKAFVAKYPKYALASQALLFLAWVAGVVNVIIAFLGWSTMSAEEKARTITGTVNMLRTAATAVPEIFGKMTLRAWNAVNRWAASAVNAMRGLLARLSDSWSELGARETTSLFDGNTQTIRPNTRWARFTAVASKAVAVIGVVVSAAFTVISVWTLLEDNGAGKPPGATIVDVLTFLANAATTVALVLHLFFGTLLFSIAASVFAIAGLVLAIVTLFLPKPEKKPPADQFMERTAIPFVNQLPIGAALHPTASLALPTGELA
jgi:hypothetical protein